MNIITGEKTFYGIKNINDKLECIMCDLNLEKYKFEVKLIISEALTNAYIHGNHRDDHKPIKVNWEICNDILCIKVKDSGQGNHSFNNNENKDLLSESGRGLLIISAYTDEVIFEGNTIIMKKVLN